MFDKVKVYAGFFENKEADAKARGQKLPKKKDPKQEYDNFLKSIADDVQEVEARQEVEAVEAAQDKADQEAFDHGYSASPPFPPFRPPRGPTQKPPNAAHMLPACGYAMIAHLNFTASLN